MPPIYEQNPDVRRPPPKDDRPAIIDGHWTETDIRGIDHLMTWLDLDVETRPPFLGYKLPTKPCTPLYCTSKQIRQELDELFARQKFERLARLAVRCFWYNEPLTAEVIELCQRSRFEMCGDMSLALAWLVRLNPAQSSCIRSLVFGKGMMFGDVGDARRAWAKPRDSLEKEDYAPITALLRTKFTELREIAIWMPRAEPMYYSDWAPIEMCWMLDDAVIDTLRLLIDGYFPEPEKHARIQDITIRERLDWNEINAKNPGRVRAAVREERERVRALGPRFELKLEYLAHRIGQNPAQEVNSSDEEYEWGSEEDDGWEDDYGMDDEIEYAEEDRGATGTLVGHDPIQATLDGGMDDAHLHAEMGDESEKSGSSISGQTDDDDLVNERIGPQPFCKWLDATTVVRLRR